MAAIEYISAPEKEVRKTLEQKMLRPENTLEERQ
jgi:hypothetical protein